MAPRKRPRRPESGDEPARGVATAPSPRRPDPEHLGQRIKFIRVSLGLTLKDLEERGGISATHLSEIERGKASPTVRALGRIAQALGIEASALLDWPSKPQASVGRTGQRGNRILRWGDGTLEPLTTQAEGTSVGAYLVLLPSGREPALSHSHEGEEWLTVLSGVAEVVVEGERFQLREGDSLHFKAHVEHSYSNPGPGTGLLLVACRPRITL